MAAPEFHLSQRKPLLPKNTNTATTNETVLVMKQMKSKPKEEWMEGSISDKGNLNHHPMRKKMDKEKTEKMLKERDVVVQLQMKEVEERGLIQRQLEMEVDMLFRLKELKSYNLRISPIKTLRERLQGGNKSYRLRG
ncbi:hypothetical protein PTKIN_Ptkin17bG0002500 [Pterospermum kingtungense]